MGFIRHLTIPTNRLHVQLVRYLFVGGVAFVADFATMVLLAEWCDLHYTVAAALGFMVGLTVNYLLSIKWVFNHRSVSNVRTEFLIFSAIGIAGLGLTEIILGIGYELFHVDYRISKLVAVALVLVWNFAARKFLLFHRASPEGVS